MARRDDNEAAQHEPQPPVPAQPEATVTDADVQAAPAEPSGDPVQPENLPVPDSQFVAPNGETVKLEQAGDGRVDSSGRPLYPWEVDAENQIGAAGKAARG